MSKRKLIERIVGIVFFVGVAAALVAVPLSTYIPYAQEQAVAKEEAIAKDNTILKSIEGKYIGNAKQSADGSVSLANEDFEVYAVFGGKYADPIKEKLESDVYSVILPDELGVTFDVTLSYHGKSCQVSVTLA